MGLHEESKKVAKELIETRDKLVQKWDDGAYSKMSAKIQTLEDNVRLSKEEGN